MNGRKILAICDPEEKYVLRLTDFLNERKIMPFEVQAFTNPESLLKYGGAHQIEVLLLSEHLDVQMAQEIGAGRVILLADSESAARGENRSGSVGNLDSSGAVDYAATNTGLPFIYKYQPADAIARQILDLYSQGKGLPAAASLRNLPLEVIGVHSPVARCGKTLFALTLGQILGEQKKTLYVNLENYSGFEALLGETYKSDLTDLVFLSRQNAGSLSLKQSSCIYHLRNLDYIPPAFFPCDIREVKSMEWIAFFAEVVETEGYETLVLDIGSEPEDIPMLLRECGRIYMPLLPDAISRAKATQFERNLEALSCSDILERMIRLYLPPVSVDRLSGRDKLLDTLVYGEMGAFVRRLLRESAKT